MTLKFPKKELGGVGRRRWAAGRDGKSHSSGSCCRSTTGTQRRNGCLSASAAVGLPLLRRGTGVSSSEFTYSIKRYTPWCIMVLPRNEERSSRSPSTGGRLQARSIRTQGSSCLAVRLAGLGERQKESEERLGVTRWRVTVVTAFGRIQVTQNFARCDY